MRTTEREGQPHLVRYVEAVAQRLIRVPPRAELVATVPARARAQVLLRRPGVVEQPKAHVLLPQAAIPGQPTALVLGRNRAPAASGSQILLRAKAPCRSSAHVGLRDLIPGTASIEPKRLTVAPLHRHRQRLLGHSAPARKARKINPPPSPAPAQRCVMGQHQITSTLIGPSPWGR
ncbi:hypothetical protein PCLA_13f0024 [Pseudomonas citronellolis]|nr:hypothetical protein PCLA_13f0024 [Pseudomonas citronellolis]